MSNKPSKLKTTFKKGSYGYSVFWFSLCWLIVGGVLFAAFFNIGKDNAALAIAIASIYLAMYLITVVVLYCRKSRDRNIGQGRNEE
ncbi:MAG: hypothetical protein MJ239_05250 [Bacilli bacterium]|nr:hypothetical protein [Bacilli bacterium]